MASNVGDQLPPEKLAELQAELQKLRPAVREKDRLERENERLTHEKDRLAQENERLAHENQIQQDAHANDACKYL